MEQDIRGWGHRWVLAVCVLAHLALLGWLVRQSPVLATPPATVLQVVFIEANPPAALAPPPPFPMAPRRPATVARIKTPIKTSSQILPEFPRPDDPEPARTPPAAPLTSDGFLQAIPQAAQEAIGGISVPERDPTKRYAAQLPGRVEPFTKEAIVLRKAISPEDVVKAAGAYLFGGADICAESQSRIRDLVARNEIKGDDELRSLIDRERRRCR